MTKKQIAKKIQKILTGLYPTPKPSLEFKDNYTLLVAVMLSANARDLIVNKVTPVLFHKADTPEKMLDLSVKEIEAIIKPCGLGPQKSKAIREMSRLLVEHFNGNVPKTFEELESLPGVGHKTASVVLSQGFGINTFPVDTHIHRCARRWGLSTGKNIKQTEKDLKAVFPEKDWGIVHLQIVHFGREYCKALRHDAKNCPVCRSLINDNGTK